MKKLILLFFFSGSLDGFSQVKDTLHLWPDGTYSVLDPGPPLKPDTLRATAIKMLSWSGFTVWVQNNLAVKGRKFIGRRGQSDLVGFTKFGQFLAVEIKTLNDRLSTDQIIFLNDVKKAGGEAYIACQEGNQVVLKEWEVQII